MQRDRLKFPLFLGLLVLCLTFVACQGGGEAADEEPPAGERVENAENGVALAEVPGFFTLVSNDANGIELHPADAAVAGTLRVLAGPVEIGGINLVAATQAHKDEILARGETAEYKGQRELLGGDALTSAAFYSRGQYDGDDGQRQEETVVFLVHPWGDRTLQLSYVYPAGDDSGARIQDQLLVVLGEVEPFGDAAPETDAGSDAPSDTDPAAASDAS